MSHEPTIGDIVALSATDDAAGVKTAIGDVLQQKVMVSLENRKKDFAQTFLTKTKTDSKEQESQEEITDCSRDTSTTG